MDEATANQEKIDDATIRALLGGRNVVGVSLLFVMMYSVLYISPTLYSLVRRVVYKHKYANMNTIHPDVNSVYILS